MALSDDTKLSILRFKKVTEKVSIDTAADEAAGEACLT